MLGNRPAPPCAGVDTSVPVSGGVDAAVVSTLESLPKAALIQALLRLGGHANGQQLTKETLHQLVKQCSGATQPSPQQGSSSSSDAHQDLPQSGINTSGGRIGGPMLAPVGSTHPSLLQAAPLDPSMCRRQFSDEVDGYPAKRQRIDDSPSECTTEFQVSALQAPTEDLACGRRELPCPKDAEGTNSIALLKSNRTLRAAQAIQAMANGGSLVPPAAPASRDGMAGAGSGPGPSAGAQRFSKKPKLQHVPPSAGPSAAPAATTVAQRQRSLPTQAPPPAAGVAAPCSAQAWQQQQQHAQAWQQQQHALVQKKSVQQQQQRVLPHGSAANPDQTTIATAVRGQQPSHPRPVAIPGAVNYSMSQHHMPPAPAAAAVPISEAHTRMAPPLAPAAAALPSSASHRRMAPPLAPAAAAAGLTYSCPSAAPAQLVLPPAPASSTMLEQLYSQVTDPAAQLQLPMYTQPPPAGSLPVLPAGHLAAGQQREAAARLAAGGPHGSSSSQSMQQPDFYAVQSNLASSLHPWGPAAPPAATTAAAAAQFEGSLQGPLGPHCSSLAASDGLGLGNGNMALPASVPVASMALSPSFADLTSLDPASLDLWAAAMAGNGGADRLLEGYSLDRLGAFSEGDNSSSSNENMLSMLGAFMQQQGGDGGGGGMNF